MFFSCEKISECLVTIFSLACFFRQKKYFFFLFQICHKKLYKFLRKIKLFNFFLVSTSSASAQILRSVVVVHFLSKRRTNFIGVYGLIFNWKLLLKQSFRENKGTFFKKNIFQLNFFQLNFNLPYKKMNPNVYFINLYYEKSCNIKNQQKSSFILRTRLNQPILYLFLCLILTFQISQAAFLQGFI